MRLLHALLLFPLIGAPVLAEPMAPPAATPHARQSPTEHFASANTTHDGHLTLDQATSGYKSIAKSFTQIDVAHHGYVTMDDIKTWKAAKKAARLAAKHAASDESEGVVRPGQPIQRWVGPKATETSTDMVVPSIIGPMPTGPRQTGVDLPMAPLDGSHHS